MFDFKSYREKAAMFFGAFGAANAKKKASWISLVGWNASTPSPRSTEYHASSDMIGSFYGSLRLLVFDFNFVPAFAHHAIAENSVSPNYGTYPAADHGTSRIVSTVFVIT